MNKQRTVKLKNLRTGETWVCENYNQKKVVDGVEFVEVHKPENPRKLWINSLNLTVVKPEK